jgi:AcrR family transcriptional regulator
MYKYCMVYKALSRARPIPVAAARPGQRMRSKLLDAAVRRFKSRGLGDVSVAEIAAEAGAFPSQVTYYFRTKEALFVEAACREMLYVARDAEIRSKASKSALEYLEIMVRSVVGAPGLSLFIEALALARRRADLQPQVKATFEKLDRESARAFAEHLASRGLPARNSAAPAHRFWMLALGLAARGAATGESVDELVAEMLKLMRVGAAK